MAIISIPEDSNDQKIKAENDIGDNNMKIGRNITLKEVQERITSGEWKTFELKRQPNIDGKNLRQTICAFANTSGGTLVIGIDNESRKPIGVGLSEQQLGQFLKQKELIHIDFTADLISCVEDIQICNELPDPIYILNIRKSTDKISVFMGDEKRDAYIRDAESNKRCDAIDIMSLYKKITREKILKTLYYEFKSQVNSLNPKQLSTIRNLKFSFFDKCRQDTDFWQILTKDDRDFLLGHPLGDTFFQGPFSLFDDIITRASKYPDETFTINLNHPEGDPNLYGEIMNISMIIERGISLFKAYYKKQGISIE